MEYATTYFNVFWRSKCIATDGFFPAPDFGYIPPPHISTYCVLLAVLLGNIQKVKACIPKYIEAQLQVSKSIQAQNDHTTVTKSWEHYTSDGSTKTKQAIRQ
jgi:hypothetical protein